MADAIDFASVNSAEAFASSRPLESNGALAPVFARATERGGRTFRYSASPRTEREAIERGVRVPDPIQPAQHHPTSTITNMLDNASKLHSQHSWPMITERRERQHHEQMTAERHWRQQCGQTLWGARRAYLFVTRRPCHVSARRAHREAVRSRAALNQFACCLSLADAA